jgi:hypothetical protein
MSKIIYIKSKIRYNQMNDWILINGNINNLIKIVNNIIIIADKKRNINIIMNSFLSLYMNKFF